MLGMTALFGKVRQTEGDAYRIYLTKRASWLGLDLERRSERVLTRVGAMLRLFTPEEGAILKKALNQLNLRIREKIIEELDTEPTGYPPIYMPAVLVNLLGNPALGVTREERLFKTVTLGLPLIARVLEKHQELLAAGQMDPNIPLNFNQIAGVAKTTPDQLEKEFTLDSEGNVLLISD